MVIGANTMRLRRAGHTSTTRHDLARNGAASPPSGHVDSCKGLAASTRTRGGGSPRLAMQPIHDMNVAHETKK